jgi:hypothetical protein
MLMPGTDLAERTRFLMDLHVKSSAQQRRSHSKAANAATYDCDRERQFCAPSRSRWRPARVGIRVRCGAGVGMTREEAAAKVRRILADGDALHRHENAFANRGNAGGWGCGRSKSNSVSK